jgi:hypothetical protein
MAQTKRAFDEVRIPLAKMTFTPDVPSAALGPNEYNDGSNVETDIRGIRSVAGESATLPDGVPGTPTFISSGFRQPQSGITNDYYFIVATVEGYWWASNGETTSATASWRDITPGAKAQFTGRIDDGTAPGAGTVLTVSSLTSGSITVGQYVSGTDGITVVPGTKILAQVSGTPGGAGVYTVSISQEIAAGTFFRSSTFNYTQAQNITEAWSGTVPIFNDEQNPPMFWPEEEGVQYPQMVAYSNLFGADIANITFVDSNTQQIAFSNVFISTGSSISGTTLTVGTVTAGSIGIGQYLSGTGVVAGTRVLNNISGTGSGSTWTLSQTQTVSSTAIVGGPYPSAPYAAGDQISIVDVNNFYNGFYVVESSTMTTINYTATPGAAYPGGGTVNPRYQWNYNPNWSSVYAKWLRLYNTPNVGNILVAGNLTATTVEGEIEIYPITVQWSQQFGLNQVPATWEPTVLNVANQLDVPLRGESLDAFPCNGQLFLCSYWDTVVFSPINYSTTTTPILGVRLFTQGRGLLSSNCWANSDKMVYGIDARDVWVFNGQDFSSLGNQRVKNWFFNELDPLYVDRVFMQTNTQKNQIEIYYPTVEAINGVPNKMLSYRYDLDIWNAPRDVNSATFATESPRWEAVPFREWTNVASTAVTGTGTGARFNISQQGSRYKAYAVQGDIVVRGSGYVVGNTVKILGTALGGTTPTNDCIIEVTGVNGSGGITNIEVPTGLANGTYTYDPGSRLVVYARGDTDRRIVEKDVGYGFINDVNGVTDPIVSVFRRDNIKILEDYSGKLLVHRIMPEANNLLDTTGVPIDPAVNIGRIGNINVTIEGANSVGQAPQASTAITMATNTDTPWTQINQNAYRVNSLVLSNSSSSTIWQCSATTWQFTQTEDDR